MNGTIFISYRRGEDSGAAGRLYDRLENTFGAGRLFMDVDNIPPGEDFVGVLQRQVAACDVLLAVIGRNWLRARDDGGRPRLENPDDFVRIEIASGLSQGKRVIPVLVDEARMPIAGELPEDLTPLARRNAVRIAHDRFKDDAERLARTLEKVLAEAEARRKAEEEMRQRREKEAAEARRKAEEAKRQRREQEKAKARRQAAEEERQQREKQSAEAQFKAGEEEQKQRQKEKDEAEARRKVEEEAWQRQDREKRDTRRAADEQESQRRQAWQLYCLGLMYQNGQGGFARDDTKALKLFRSAAQQGNLSAQSVLAWIYANGRGVVRDDAEAVHWYRKLAEQGDTIAQYNLGGMYKTGRGVAKDDAQAVKWYRKAAEMGDRDAQYSLGVSYATGQGVARDYGEAVQWYRKAADQGHDGAREALRTHGIARADGRWLTFKPR